MQYIMLQIKDENTSRSMFKLYGHKLLAKQKETLRS